jgi:hypothetical protein
MNNPLLTNCSTCGEPVATAAQNCPRCGALGPAAAARARLGRGPRDGSAGCGAGCGLFMMLLVLFSLLSVLIGPTH